MDVLQMRFGDLSGEECMALGQQLRKGLNPDQRLMLLQGIYHPDRSAKSAMQDIQAGSAHDMSQQQTGGEPMAQLT